MGRTSGGEAVVAGAQVPAPHDSTARTCACAATCSGRVERDGVCQRRRGRAPDGAAMGPRWKVPLARVKSQRMLAAAA
jgi:hypothetical protein